MQKNMLEKKAGSKTQQAYDAILNKILSNEYPPGMFLSSRELCEQLGLSRTPIKDALLRLSIEGFVDNSPEIGVVVSKVGLSDVLELYEVRFALEGYSTYLAALRHTESDLENLRKHLNSHEKSASSDVVLANQEDDAFHIAVAKSSCNSRLAVQIETNILQCRRAAIYQNQQNAGRMERSAQQHEVILEAIARRDPEAAKDAMTSHLSDVIATTKELMLENYYMYR